MSTSSFRVRARVRVRVQVLVNTSSFMSENTPVGFDVISVITAELSAKVSRGQATPSASHSAASSRKMYLHAFREGIRTQSECNQVGSPT